MGKKILVLGAGFVSKPCVQYLLKNPKYQVYVADKSGSQVDRVLDRHPRGKALSGDVNSSLGAWLDDINPDIVVTLLPKPFFYPVARACVDRGLDFILPTTATPEVAAMKDEIESAGVCGIAELGVDPGVDHMIAMRSIEAIKSEGGNITGFWSVCGSLPAPGSNTNPLGYKMSWAPNHVVYAGTKDALFRDGTGIVNYPGGETFEHYEMVEIDGVGWFECFADGNALPYAGLYGIDGSDNLKIFRGTLRYPGWCEMYTSLRRIGLFNDERIDPSVRTFDSLLRWLIKSDPQVDLKISVARFLGVPVFSSVLSRIEWLGLFDDKSLPADSETPSEVLCSLLMEKLNFAPGEKDLVLMEQRIDYHDSKGRNFIKSSILVEEGIVGVETAIAKTTGFPIAMGAEMVLEGFFRKPGLFIPVSPEIYRRLLGKLDEEGIRLVEKVTMNN